MRQSPRPRQAEGTKLREPQSLAAKSVSIFREFQYLSYRDCMRDRDRFCTIGTRWSKCLDTYETSENSVSLRNNSMNRRLVIRQANNIAGECKLCYWSRLVLMSFPCTATMCSARSADATFHHALRSETDDLLGIHQSSLRSVSKSKSFFESKLQFSQNS